MKLLSINSDAKTVKGTVKGYLTGILYLAPATVAGIGNLCPHSSKGCRDACLFTAGRAAIFATINRARIEKTRSLFRDRAAFGMQLEKEIESLCKAAARKGLKPAVRLNGTSDLAVESLFPGLMVRFPRVAFYDYTKAANRAHAWRAGTLPKNYHLTFSLSESNGDKAHALLKAGVNVCAVVDRPEAFAKGFTVNGESFETFNADLSDLRFKDKAARDGRGRVGILKAKGDARKDATGFVTRSC